MLDVTFHAKAYCKIILHCAKYPHCAVNGILLAKATKGNQIEFVDAIPLFHIALNLTPMAEIALTQIEQFASRNGLVIAGYYTAHENLKESSLEKANHKIAEKIAEFYNSACLVVVDNSSLNLKMDTLALKIGQYTEGKYRPLDAQRVSITPAHTLDTCSSLLEKRAYKQLIDFDNHLDDLKQDWANDDVNEEIQSLL